VSHALGAAYRVTPSPPSWWASPFLVWSRGWRLPRPGNDYGRIDAPDGDANLRRTIGHRPGHAGLVTDPPPTERGQSKLMM